jgi:hypothetical protein
MEKHMLDKTTVEGNAIDEALKALKALKEQTPTRGSKMWQHFFRQKKPRQARYCLEQSKPNSTACWKATLTQDSETNAVTAALLSNSNKWATSIYNAPLTPEPWCTAKQFVTVLRLLRLGLTNMDLPPRDHKCEVELQSPNVPRAHVPLLQAVLQTPQRNCPGMREDVPHSR